MGNDRKSSMVVICSEGFVVLAGCECFCVAACLSGVYEGDDANVEGVRGDDEPCDEDSGLEGSSSGTDTVAR